MRARTHLLLPRMAVAVRPPAAAADVRAGVMSVQPWARWFYKSKAWERTREAYIAYRHGLCERCGAGGKIVHHRVHLTPENIHDPAVTLSFDNLELLCQECHNREHHERVPIAEGLRFTADGDLIAVR